MEWLGAIAGPLINSFFADERASEANQSNQMMQQASIASQEAWQREQMGWAREQQTRNEQLQREFAQHGIAWRVEDARQAGVHPMYALGGGGAAFSPNPVIMSGSPDYSPKFSHVSPQQYDLGGGLVKALTQLFSDAKKDEAIANSAAAVAALARNQAVGGTPFPAYGNVGDEFDAELWRSGLAGRLPTPMNLQNAIDVSSYSPAQVTSSRRADMSLTPGNPPGGTEFQLAPGFRMILPASPQGGISEGLEAISESYELAYAYVQRNVDEYGMEWLDKAQRYLPVTATLAKVINNVRNAWGWVAGEGSGAAWDALGHRSLEWLNDFRNRKERGPTVSGRIRR